MGVVVTTLTFSRIRPSTERSTTTDFHRKSMVDA